jgi:aminopeptidase
MSSILDDILVDEELVEGAYNAVNVCLRVKPHEKVTIITDERTHDIADAIHCEVAKTGATCNKFLLEDFASRP